MTRRALSTGGRMLRVIEADVETSQRRERLRLSALRIAVTDRTDLTRLVRKLLSVAAGARRV